MKNLIKIGLAAMLAVASVGATVDTASARPHRMFMMHRHANWGGGNWGGGNWGSRHRNWGGGWGGGWGWGGGGFAPFAGGLLLGYGLGVIAPPYAYGYHPYAYTSCRAHVSYNGSYWTDYSGVRHYC